MRSYEKPLLFLNSRSRWCTSRTPPQPEPPLFLCIDPEIQKCYSKCWSRRFIEGTPHSNRKKCPHKSHTHTHTALSSKMQTNRIHRCPVQPDLVTDLIICKFTP